MKLLKSISLFCFILFLTVLLGLVFFSIRAKRTTPIPEQTEEKRTEEHISTNNNSKQDLTVSTKQNVTTCDTIYEVKSYIGNDYLNAVEELPFSFIGLTMDELLKEIERYEASPSFTDKQKGFVSIELLSFHPEKISVKKVYQEEEEKIIYYLKALNHELVVYRSDQKEVYMPTDLTLDMLPIEVQQEIIHTKCFNDIREVYDFLESYTS